MRMRSHRFLPRWPLVLLFSLAPVVAIFLCAAASRGNSPVRLIPSPRIAPAPISTFTADLLPETLLPIPQLRAAKPLLTVSASRAPELQTYRGKTFRFVKTLTLRVTAYAPDPRCCYPYDGTTTASGHPVTTNGGKLVAADTDLISMFSLVLVPGYAQSKPVPVLDRGGAIKGRRLDVLLPTFSQAKSWGARTLQVKIYEPL
jgi:3D (Asp-Asp-Asp) domain-containing protein